MQGTSDEHQEHQALLGHARPAPLTRQGRPRAGNRRGYDIVHELFANATRARLNVVRLYAHTTDPDHPFQVRRAPRSTTLAGPLRLVPAHPLPRAACGLGRAMHAAGRGERLLGRAGPARSRSNARGPLGVTGARPRSTGCALTLTLAGGTGALQRGRVGGAGPRAGPGARGGPEGHGLAAGQLEVQRCARLLYPTLTVRARPRARRGAAGPCLRPAGWGRRGMRRRRQALLCLVGSL
jgi:hypothetical protein